MLRPACWAFFLVGLAACLEQGVVFEGGQDVLLTDSYWSVTLEYNLTELEEEAANISILLVEVKSHYDNFFEKIKNENISMHSPLVSLESNFLYQHTTLQLTVHEYLNEINDLVTLLPRKRPKRGLMDAGGHLLKFLFGTLDSTDLEVINSKMDALYDSTQNMVHDSREQITVMGQMEEELLSHAQTINKIIANLKTYHTNMHKSIKKFFISQQIAETQLQNLFQYIRLSSALTDVKDTVNAAIHKIVKFHNAIEGLAEGKISSDLLSPHQYLTILQSIENVLTPPAKLYLPVTLENLHNFAQVAIVRSYTTAHTLRVIVQIPVKNDNQLFQMYDVISYPVYDHYIKRWAQWEVDRKKLLISKDRLMYTLYESDQFSKECQHGELAVCPLAQVIMSVSKRPCCIVELFSKEETTMCDRKIISGLESPLLIRTPFRWIYSASMEHRVTLNCYEIDGSVNVTSLLIKGVGELNGVENCDIITDAFKVPASIHGSTIVTGKMGKVKLPDIKSMFVRSEEELMRSDVNVTIEVLQGLDEELGTLGVKEHRLESVLQKIRSHQYLFGIYRPSKRPAFIMLTIGLVLLLIVCVLINRRRQQVGAWLLFCLFCRRRPQTADPTTPTVPQPAKRARVVHTQNIGIDTPEEAPIARLKSNLFRLSNRRMTSQCSCSREMCKRSRL